MRKLLVLGAAMAVAGCTTTNDMSSGPAGALSLANTTWEFSGQNGMPLRQSFDANGNYIVVSGATHIDHGTSVVKDGKLCLTSKMTGQGEMCWSDPKLAIGESGETTSDGGEKLVIRRVAYVPLTM